MTLDCEVVITREGHKAIRDRTTGQLMHPVVGPAIEAERLYVGPSKLATRLADGASLVLLDVGLGAGSNAIAAWRVAEASAGRLEIVSFDRSLAALELALDPAHAFAFGFEDGAATAGRAIAEARAHETARTRWRLVLGELDVTLASQSPAIADVVFWDPFSPRANPDLWTTRAFASLFRLCRAGATVHTYGGATATRSAMLLAGFAVGEGVDLGGGKHATCAALDPAELERPLDRRWLERLERSSAPFPTDAPTDALRRIRALPQFG